MNRNKNALKSLLLILTFVVSLFAGASQTFAAKGTDNARDKGGNAWAYGRQGQEETIRFAAINDFHGNVEEYVAEKQASSNPGIAKMAGYLNDLREDMPTYFLSAGDNFQGTAISNLTHGEVVNEAFNLMDLVASAIGNHEYDWGKDMMYDWSEEGNYPFLASNIVYKDSGEPVDYADPYMIKRIRLSSGKFVRIGIIGIATPETATKTLAANVADIDFTDPIKATNKWVKYLKNVKKVDAVIALTHLGGSQKDGVISGEVANYAMGVKDVDVIFSGHSHQNIDGIVNGIQILQARYNGRGFQIAELTFNNKTTDLVKVDGYVDLINLRQAELPIDPKVAALIDKYNDELADILNEPVGTNAQTLDHDTAGIKGLTPLGQWTAKALTEIGGTQIAIINGGGIREPMPAGPITMRTMYALFPFDNTLVTLKVKGSHLIELIKHGIDPATFKDGQFYGVVVEVDWTDGSPSQLIKITLPGGEEIDLDAWYTVSTLDFLITGGDSYNFSGAMDVVDTFMPVRNALVEYIRALPDETLVHVFDGDAYVAY